MEEKEKDFSISAKIKCSDGSDLERQRLLKTEEGKPDATLLATEGEALRAFSAFVGAFIGAFMKGMKEKAVKENKGDIEEVEFTLSNGEENVEKKTLGKEDIEKITKK